MQNNNLNDGGTIALAKAGLVAGTTSTYTTTKAVPVMINGQFGTELAIKTNQATPTTDHRTGLAFVALAASEGAVIVFGVIDAGTIVATQGEIKALDINDDTFRIDPPFPGIPDTMMPFGYVIIENGATASAFTFGTTSFTATGVVDTFTDCAFLPDRPQQAT